MSCTSVNRLLSLAMESAGCIAADKDGLEPAVSDTPKIPVMVGHRCSIMSHQCPPANSSLEPLNVLYCIGSPMTVVEVLTPHTFTDTTRVSSGNLPQQHHVPALPDIWHKTQHAKKTTPGMCRMRITFKA